MSEKRKVKIFGVPLDLGANRLGVDMGPMAIRYAGLKDALEYNGIELNDCGDLVVNHSVYNNDNGDSGEKSLEQIARVSEKLSELTYGALAEGYTPLILGGDHSASIGSIAGASKKAERLGLLWLDKHPDSNTPETSPTGNVHGMTVAISLGHGYPELTKCSGFSPKISPENISMLGINDVDKGEEQFLKRSGISVFSLMDIERMGIVKVVEEALKIVTNSCDMIHVSFDVDVLDPLIAPGSGILSRGGLSYREISYVMKSIGEADIVSSMDVIEINPLLDVKNRTAELAVELVIASLGGTFGDYERNYLKFQRRLP
jgi:arginase